MRCGPINITLERSEWVHVGLDIVRWKYISSTVARTCSSLTLARSIPRRSNVLLTGRAPP